MSRRCEPPDRRAGALLFAASLAVSACAQGAPPTTNERSIDVVEVEFEQDIVVRSSVLRFRFLDTADHEARLGTVTFSGSLGEGRALEKSFDVPVDRLGDRGDLIVEIRVKDELWELVEPDPERTLTGHVDLTLEDDIGTFAVGEVESTALRFRASYPPQVEPLQTGRSVFPNQQLKIVGDGFLRPEEGTTWAIVDTGRVDFDDGSSRSVTNARAPVRWSGARTEATLPVDPALFGIATGTFSGALRFENELRTGETYEGSSQARFDAELLPPRVESLSPDRGSRGQKITVKGRGFVPEELRTNSGTYFVLEGVLEPDDPELPKIEVEGNDQLVVTPFRVLDETTAEQNVSYEIVPGTRRITGLGAVPGVFTGTVTPWIYRGDELQEGAPWSGEFTVLPTRQVVYLKFLPGFSKALENYGLRATEAAIRDRIVEVLERDYAEANVEIVAVEPDHFIEYTTIEIGGPDPSGLLNFGYDNSFNDGGKDIDNLYLSDYLGGVNRHSQEAGYLPYGGVFIESFISFSPTLFPDNFGTSAEFDRVIAPFMFAFGGRPVSDDEWPEGPREAAIAQAVAMIGNLTGHTASHEVGHSLGLAYFDESEEMFDERFHNDPPGPNLIMDSGADRPFTERAELNGDGPARFSRVNTRYLQSVLPLP